MNKKWIPISALAVLMSSSVVNANVNQWSLGVGASYSPDVYKETPSNKTVIPVVGYEGEHFFMRGFSAGYRLNPIGATHNIIFRAVYDPRTLKPEDSDNAVVQKMDERDASILGGVSYQLTTLVGMVEATAGTDLGGKHNGLYSELAWRLPIHQRGWGFTPSIGYAYNSDNINNHLYGVTQTEADRAGIEAFDADWDGQYFVGLSGYMHLTPNIRVAGGVRYTNLEGDIENSPLIESGVYTAANVSVVYTF